MRARTRDGGKIAGRGACKLVEVEAPLHVVAASELDAATLAAARAGEPRARRAFVVLYQDRVFRLLRRMLRPSRLEAAVDDLAQETFLRAFAALPRFDPGRDAKASTWLLTIATRLAIDLLRRRPVDAAADEPTATGAPADDVAALEQAIARLPPDQRAALLLHAHHGFEHVEIAEALAIRPGTVASRIARAKAALRRALGGEES